MLITIDTEEALKFSLSIQDCAVLDVIRRLLAADGGATEAEGSRNFKWLSNSTILRHLQCSSFRSPRQLHNIINKLCAVGLLIKKMWYGKPYYSAILRKSKNVGAAPRVSPSRAAAPSVAPSIPGTPAAPDVAPPVPRRVDAPTVAAAPKDPTPEELAAHLANLDRKIENYDKRQRDKFRATVATFIPTAEEIRIYAQSMQMQDFDLNGFITFNTERNWSALRKRTWRQLAAQWYEQQCKKMSELITYDKYCEIAGKDHAAAKIWTFHHKDPKTGVSYFARANSTPTDPPPQNQSGRPSGQPPRDTQQKSVL